MGVINRIFIGVKWVFSISNMCMWMVFGWVVRYGDDGVKGFQIATIWIPIDGFSIIFSRLSFEAT